MVTSADVTFLYLLKRVELAARARLDEAIEPFGVTAVQYTALAALERHPDMTAAALARYSFVTAQTTAQLVRGLEERGWITRHPDPTSRRQMLLLLTPAGQALLDQARGPVQDIEERMTADVPGHDLVQARAVLESFRTAVED